MAGNNVYVQGNYVDIHDNEVVNLSIDKAGTVHVQGNVQPHDDITEVPSVLDTSRARELWQKAIAEGWVTEQLQPLLSRSDAALLAGRIAEILGIEGWKPFEQLWNRKNIRSDYNDALCQRKALDFQNELKKLFAE